MRFALGLAYDGSGMAGWQTQPHGNTGQDLLERALCAVADHPVSTVCAGRTDAGVHALAQVVHFDTEARRSPTAWVRGANSRLPPGVAVQWVQEVPESFHARYSARSRTYRYLLRCGPVRHPLWQQRAGQALRELSIDKMREAAQHLLGEHDFSTFRSSLCQAASPVRDLRRLDIRRRGALIQFELQANAFLHHMVRNLVGALVYVGDGRQKPDWVLDLLAARDRARSAPTFAAAGLYLAGVEYEPALGLPGGLIDPLGLESTA